MEFLETTNKTTESTPSMEDFQDEIANSFKDIEEGDLITGTVIGISDTEVTIDLGYYTDGIIDIKEVSNDPSFSIKSNIKVGDTVSAMVILTDNGNGNISLSMKRAANILAWDTLQKALESKKIYSTKITEAVHGGVITYIEGIRGFIPASHLSLTYVKDLEAFVGTTIQAIVITVDEQNRKLVLSGKEVERDQLVADRNDKLTQLQRGSITIGTVQKIVPYGAFVDIGDNLSGLVHISQICQKHIKSPNEVLKEGEQVTVKIIDIQDGKISLSIKAVEESAIPFENTANIPSEYTSQEPAATSLASLLSGFQLD